MNILRITKKFFIFILIISLSACGYTSPYTADFFSMDTAMTVTSYGQNSKTAVKAVEDEINRLNLLWSVENEQSEIFLLNRDKRLTVCDDTRNLISRAKEISDLTDGDFDITVQPLVADWGFYSALENRVPTQSEIDTTLKFVGYENINLSDNDISLEHNASIDLGGIAKGYASYSAAEILKKQGIESAVMSLGGNVRVIGTKPDGTDWTVAIADPDDNSSNIGIVKVTDTAVITSGGYQRYFEEDKKVYHHIIDPKTGYPAQSGLKSVTIVSSDDILADALSTALFVKGLDASIEFYKQNNELFEAIFMTEDNKIFITPKLEDAFSSNREFEVIKP